MGRIRVVIADDSRLARDLLRAIFEAEPGMEVVGEASNGREAVALVQQLRPHLVTMDLEMPLMDGVAAVEEIMCTRAVPILVVSSVADAPRALDAVAHGALEIVPKPDTTPEAAAHLLARARLLAGVSVITRLRARPSAAPSPFAEAAPGVLTAAPTPAPVLTHALVPACVGGGAAARHACFCCGGFHGGATGSGADTARVAARLCLPGAGGTAHLRWLCPRHGAVAGFVVSAARAAGVRWRGAAPGPYLHRPVRAPLGSDGTAPTAMASAFAARPLPPLVRCAAVFRGSSVSRSGGGYRAVRHGPRWGMWPGRHPGCRGLYLGARRGQLADFWHEPRGH